MALEHLAYYLFPARGCENQLKTYFRHLAGSREEGRSTSPSVPREGDDAQLGIRIFGADDVRYSEGDKLFRVRDVTTSGNVALAYLQHLLIAAVLNVSHDSDKGYPNPKCVRGWRNLVVSINIQTMLSLEPEPEY